jgi:putative transposase
MNSDLIAKAGVCASASAWTVWGSVAATRRCYPESMSEAPKKMMIEPLRKVLKRLHYPIEVMLVCVRWYAAYPSSLRHVEEMMAERGVVVDHTTVHRWAVKMLPILAAVMRRRKRPVGLSSRMDETCVKVGGQWKYLYRAVDRSGQTLDFLLRAHRDYAAARCFFERAIDLHGVPERITIDKSGANTAAIEALRADSGADIEMRQSKYLNNLIEQDHRGVKRIVRPMLGFKNFRCARALIAGIETMHMIKKNQLDGLKGRAPSAAQQF